jgi:hypothetical protein
MGQQNISENKICSTTFFFKDFEKNKLTELLQGSTRNFKTKCGLGMTKQQAYSRF